MVTNYREFGESLITEKVPGTLKRKILFTLNKNLKDIIALKHRQRYETLIRLGYYLDGDPAFIVNMKFII